MPTIRKRGVMWQAQIRLSGIRPRSASFTTKSKAMKWGVEEERKLLSGDTTTKKDIRKLNGLTLGALAKEWIESGQVKNRDAGVGYRCLLNDPIAKRPVLEVTKKEVQAWKKRQLARVSESSVRNYASVPRRAWSYGEETLELPLPSNPFTKLNLSRAKSKRLRRLNPGEYELLMASCVSEARYAPVGEHILDNMPDVINWAIETAMRRGEIARVNMSHLTECKRFLHIPKTKNGKPRTIPLTQKAQEIAARRILLGFKPKLFPYAVSSLTNTFKSICTYAKIEDLRLHDMRHEALSRLNELGMSAFDIKLVSGHTDTRCLNVYVHSDLQRVADRMGA